MGAGTAHKIVSSLLENEQPLGQYRKPSRFARTVRIRTPKGDVINAEWNGYYDLRDYNGGVHHSIGYPDGQGGFSHGWLHQGDEFIDQPPSFEEWEQMRKERDAQVSAEVATGPTTAA